LDAESDLYCKRIETISRNNNLRSTLTENQEKVPTGVYFYPINYTYDETNGKKNIIKNKKMLLLK